MIARALLCLAFCLPTLAFAQYNPTAGQNAPMAVEDRPMRAKSGEVLLDDEGKVRTERVRVSVAKDTHGNARGNNYDLAMDGAFEGQTVLIIDQVGNTLVNTRAALRVKGFSSVVLRGKAASAGDLRGALKKSCQLWLISSGAPVLPKEQIVAIKHFFDAGHGVYIWGDNTPLYADANRLAAALVPGLGMKGNTPGNQVVGISRGKGKAGVREGHLVTTGLEFLYEGVTIATIHPHQELTPLLYGSIGNLVTAAYEKNDKRLLIDGGFTRLAVNWDDAGTARYVKNAAAWLTNAERFGDAVVATRGEQR